MVYLYLPYVKQDLKYEIYMHLQNLEFENFKGIQNFFNSSLASRDFCHLLITFENSLDPDQDQQNIGPDLDPNCLTIRQYSWKVFWKGLFWKKSGEDNRSMKIKSGVGSNIE